MRPLAVCLTLGLAAAACGSGGAPGAAGDAATATGGAAGSDAGASGGVRVTGTGGSGGTPSVTPPDGATDRLGPVADGGGVDLAGDMASLACAPGAVFCDDFESYALDPKTNITQEFSPNWLKYKFHGNPYVWTSMSFKGKQNLGLDTEAGDLRYAGIIRQTADNVPVAPRSHYGRVMFWLKAMPAVSDWNFIHVSGLLPDATNKVAQYSFGGAGGKLAVSYVQRTRVLDASGGVALRGGGPQNGDPRPDVQCTVKATTQTLPTMKWTCVEWHIDGDKNEVHLWLDGVAETEVDVVGSGGTCSIGTTTAWQAPPVFSKLVLDWEAYQKDAPQQTARFDDVVLGWQRIGCP
jgi:hypothetical protein